MVGDTAEGIERAVRRLRILSIPCGLTGLVCTGLDGLDEGGGEGERGVCPSIADFISVIVCRAAKELLAPK